MTDHYPFTLLPLPYPYNALEPFIDEETMHYHHDKHLQTYVDNLNKILSNYPQLQSFNLPTLLANLSELPKDLQTPIKNNGGGVFNHNLYFSTMTSPKKDNMPVGTLATAINSDFGSYANFKQKLSETAVSQFGSGYGWLVTDSDGKLHILGLPNQDTPLETGYMPLLLVDIWEHAYYLKYKNLRSDYVNNWFNLINWPVVENLYRTRNNYFDN